MSFRDGFSSLVHGIGTTINRLAEEAEIEREQRLKDMREGYVAAHREATTRDLQISEILPQQRVNSDGTVCKHVPCPYHPEK